MDLKEHGLVAGEAADHWYYKAKFAALVSLLDGLRARSVLDVGAGSGFFARELLKCDHVASATCVDPGYHSDRDELVQGKPLHYRRCIDRPDADLVLLMDVIEHVDDDLTLLRSYVRSVADGARFVITAPAFRWLWSDHDVFLGHRRRYTLGEVRAVAEGAGLIVDQACYFYGLLFPLAAVSRLLGRLVRAVARRCGHPKTARSQMRSLGALLNGSLWSACRAELPIFHYNRLFGLTVMIVARKVS